MKFIDQSLFEVGTLFLAIDIADQSDNLTTSKHELFRMYRDSYPGDHLWVDQASEAALSAYELAKKIAPQNPSRLLAVAMEVRKTLGDDLRPVSGVSKLLDGTWFARSHPSPESRVQLSRKNFQTLLVLVNSRLDDI